MKAVNIIISLTITTSAKSLSLLNLQPIFDC